MHWQGGNMVMRNKKTKIQKEPKKLGKAAMMQQMKDLQHKIQMEVSAYIVLIEEGSKEQIILAHNRAKSALLKYGPDLKKMAHQGEQEIIDLINQYLDSVDSMVHCQINEIDQGRTNRLYESNQKLQKKLR